MPKGFPGRQVSILLTPELAARLDAQTHARAVSRQQVCIRALERFLVTLEAQGDPFDRTISDTALTVAERQAVADRLERQVYGRPAGDVGHRYDDHRGPTEVELDRRRRAAGAI